jgi:DNA polymerase
VERADDIDSPAAAASALQWWLDAGVDCLVAEEPRDWLKPKAEPAAAPTAEAPAGDLPGQLDLFQTWLGSADSMPFASPSAPRVCPAGDPTSGLMIITDMPTGEDCESGILLSGDTGRLFDRILAAIGRDRESIYLAALSCLRPPGGQLADEPARQCAILARHHIGLAAPRAVLLFGDSCCKILLGLPVTRARGRWHEIATHSGAVPTLATYAPAFLLTRPSAKAQVWADLQMLMEGLK